MEHEEWDVGRRVRIMWDGPGMPLWDDVNGRMPEEIEFLAGFLLLSQNLIDDLRSWGEAEPGLAGFDIEDWDSRALILRDRLQGELGPDFTVAYHPMTWSSE